MENFHMDCELRPKCDVVKEEPLQKIHRRESICTYGILYTLQQF